MFLALVAGTFTGMGGMLLILSVSGRKRKPKAVTPKKQKPMPLIEREVPKENELPDIPLTRKMPPKEFSIADFNCAADGLETEEHISSQQQRQDNAYNALKRRKRK